MNTSDIELLKTSLRISGKERKYLDGVHQRLFSTQELNLAWLDAILRTPEGIDRSTGTLTTRLICSMRCNPPANSPSSC